MKSEKHENQKSDYPKLMEVISSKINAGAVVFFLYGGEGTCLHEAGNIKLGDQSSGWNIDHFQDFQGTITLSNN